MNVDGYSIASRDFATARIEDIMEFQEAVLIKAKNDAMLSIMTADPYRLIRLLLFTGSLRKL